MGLRSTVYCVTFVFIIFTPDLLTACPQVGDDDSVLAVSSRPAANQNLRDIRLLLQGLESKYELIGYAGCAQEPAIANACDLSDFRLLRNDTGKCGAERISKDLFDSLRADLPICVDAITGLAGPVHVTYLSIERENDVVGPWESKQNRWSNHEAARAIDLNKISVGGKTYDYERAANRVPIVEFDKKKKKNIIVGYRNEPTPEWDTFWVPFIACMKSESSVRITNEFGKVDFRNDKPGLDGHHNHLHLSRGSPWTDLVDDEGLCEKNVTRRRRDGTTVRQNERRGYPTDY